MKQIFLMTVGFTHCGKEFLVDKIIEKIPSFFNRINTSPIHDFLNQTYPAFKDDNTVGGRAYKMRDEASRTFRLEIVDILLKHGRSVILESCNLAAEKRKNTLEKVKKINPDIKTVIIYFDVPEEKILQNLKEADERSIAKGEAPPWVELYEKVQKKDFEEPDPEESDYFITYNWKNVDEVLERVRRIIES